MIGRGKAFGAGQIFARQITLNIRRNDAAAVEEKKVDWFNGAGRHGLETRLADFERAIAPLAGSPSVANWSKSLEVAELLKIATLRGWSAPGTNYLPFDRQGKGLKTLREKTGLGVLRTPQQLNL